MFTNFRNTIALILLLSVACPVDAAWRDVKEIVAMASIATNVPSGELATVGYLESSFRPSVKSKHGSATGLMQITKPTWDYLVRTYGSAYDITKVTLPTDPRANSIMAALYLKENRVIMERRLKRNISVLELYLGHKFGPERATRLLTADGDRTLLDFYPGAASRNKQVYYHTGGVPKTINEVKHMFELRVSRAYQKYAGLALLEVAKVKAAVFTKYQLAYSRGAKDCVATNPSPTEILAALATVTTGTYLHSATVVETGEYNMFTYIGFAGGYTSGKRFNGYLV